MKKQVIIASALLLSACSIPNSKDHLHPNLDYERNLDNVEVTEEEIFFFTNAHCIYLFAERGLYKEAAILGSLTALGSPNIGCVVMTIPTKRKPFRVDADRVIYVQREDCKKQKCVCHVIYTWDPFEYFRDKEIFHCKGYMDVNIKKEKERKEEYVY